jgi:hypothetical protein
MSLFTNEVNVDNTVLVDGSAVTQPISAASLPLPAGAATNASVVALTKPSDTQLVDGSAHTQPVSGTVTVNGTVTANAGTGTLLVDGSAHTQPVSGTFFQATQPVSGTVSISGTVPTTVGSIASATVTSNNVGSASAVTLLASRAARSKFVIFNEAGTLFVKLGSAATSSDYTVRLTVNTDYEFSGYSGIVTAIKASGTTNVQVTDI